MRMTDARLSSLKVVGRDVSVWGNGYNEPGASADILQDLATVDVAGMVLVCRNGRDEDPCPWESRCREYFEEDYCCGEEDCVGHPVCYPWPDVCGS